MPRRELAYSKELFLTVLGLNERATLLAVETQHRTGEVRVILDDPDWRVACPEGCVPPVEVMDGP